MNSYSRGSIKRVGRFGSWPTRTITFEDTELDWENNVARSNGRVEIRLYPSFFISIEFPAF